MKRARPVQNKTVNSVSSLENLDADDATTLLLDLTYAKLQQVEKEITALSQLAGLQSDQAQQDRPRPKLMQCPYDSEEVYQELQDFFKSITTTPEDQSTDSDDAKDTSGDGIMESTDLQDDVVEILMSFATNVEADIKAVEEDLLGMPMSADFHALMMGPQMDEASDDAFETNTEMLDSRAFSISTTPYSSEDIMGQPIARREITCFGISYLCSRARMRGAHQAMQLLRQRYDTKMANLKKENERLRKLLEDNGLQEKINEKKKTTSRDSKENSTSCLQILETIEEDLGESSDPDEEFEEVEEEELDKLDSMLANYSERVASLASKYTVAQLREVEDSNERNSTTTARRDENDAEGEIINDVGVDSSTYSKLAQLTMFRRQPLLAMDINDSLADDTNNEQTSNTDSLRGPCGSMLVRVYPPDETNYVQ